MKYSHKDLEDEWSNGYLKLINEFYEKPYILTTSIFTSLYIGEGSPDDEYNDWKNLQWGDISKNPNITWEIIKNNLDMPWAWFYVTENPNITWEIIKNNPDMQWHWRCIKRNPNITWDIVKSNLDIPWDWDSFFDEVDLPDDDIYQKYEIEPSYTKSNHFWKNYNAIEEILKFVKEHPEYSWNWEFLSKIVDKELLYKYPDNDWNWDLISGSPNLSFEYVLEHLDKPWHWNRISLNPSITWENIKSNLDKNWDWYNISSNPSITWENIQSNLDKDWDWYNISEQHYITWDIVISNPDIPWDWECLSMHQNITLEHILSNLDCPWEWKYISYNPNLTADIIEQNMERDWDWYTIQQNYNIPCEDILRVQTKFLTINSRNEDTEHIRNRNDFKIEHAVNNPDLSWGWHLSCHQNVTLKDIQDHPNIKWNWFSVSGNPNLTWEFILDNPTLHWKWGDDGNGPCISNNKMKNGKETWINNRRLQIIKTLQIQRHWRNCTNNPEYKLALKIIKERMDISS